MYLEKSKEKFEALRNKENVVVLAIESSCDETSVAVVKNGREVLSNVISSQIDIHKRFGGVVPEVASRNHIMAIDNVVDEAINQSGLTIKDIDAVAVTYGAGLVGCLMVGVSFAKALAYALDVPLIKVNHIKGHMCANYIACATLEPPFIGLIVSGGHTALVKVVDYNVNELIGTTTDDAVGEAYDKVAKVLGLGYPGGPKVDKLAKEGTPNIEFVNLKHLEKGFDFSFSGLKTAVINYIHKLEQRGEKVPVEDICASFQNTVSELLTVKTISACKKYKINKVAVAGGVACNSGLREKLTRACDIAGIEIHFPPAILCTDNAGMIGCEAYYSIKGGVNLADLSLTATPSINLKYSYKKD